jgi:hypothetical protein
MQEHQITLVEIRREAMLLELDVDISSGYLEIFKRSDASTGFYSLQDANDPRVLIAAWQFLQFYRVQLDQFDAARRELANHPLQRPARRAAILYRLAVFVLAVGAGALVALVAADSILALVVFLIIFAAGGLLRPRRLFS